MGDKPKPIETFRIGSLDFAMWENQGEDLRTFQSVSIKRTYMDGNGNWQSGGEIKLLPQQLADLRLGSDKMFEFWRLGMKPRKQQGQGEARTPNSAEQQTEQQRDLALAPDPERQAESPAEPKSPESPSLAGQGELSVVGAGEQSFREKTSQSRGSRRSR